MNVLDVKGGNINQVAAEVWAGYGDITPEEFLNGRSIEEAVEDFAENWTPQTGIPLPVVITEWGSEYTVGELFTIYLENGLEDE